MNKNEANKMWTAIEDQVKNGNRPDYEDEHKPEGGWETPIALCCVDAECKIRLIEILNCDKVKYSLLEFINEDYSNTVSLDEYWEESEVPPGVYTYELVARSEEVGNPMDGIEYDSWVDYNNPKSVMLNV